MWRARDFRCVCVWLKTVQTFGPQTMMSAASANTGRRLKVEMWESPEDGLDYSPNIWPRSALVAFSRVRGVCAWAVIRDRGSLRRQSYACLPCSWEWLGRILTSLEGDIGRYRYRYRYIPGKGNGINRRDHLFKELTVWLELTLGISTWEERKMNLEK